MPRTSQRTSCFVLALLACAASGHAGADTATAIPPRLTGAWSNETLTYTGPNQQATLFLQADGHGLLVGSQAAVRADGVDDGKPAPRVVAGFPVHAAFAGATLTLDPFMPGQPATPSDTRMRMTCADDAAAATLTCTGPDRKALVMQRRSETLPPEVAGMLGSLQF